MIYTFYFGGLKKLSWDTLPIGIVRYRPSWFSGYNFSSLVPSAELLNAYKEGLCSPTLFTTRFHAETLSGLDPQVILRDLHSLGIPHVALCCFERPGEFCHRRIVAQWLEMHTDAVINEFVP